MAEERTSAVLARGAAALGSTAEARTLLCHVLGVEPTALLLVPQVAPDVRGAFDALVARRLSGVPVQHLTGVAAFRTITVRVGPGVFIPRPETEVMTGWALERLAAVRSSGTPRPVVVELCAGSGAISAALAAEGGDLALHAVELSADAAGYLRANLASTGADVREGDMANAFADLDGRVDVVIANPPYVPEGDWAGLPDEVRDHDPVQALVSGADGLDALRVVAQVAARLLRPGGWVCAEHAESHTGAAPALFLAAGFADVADHRDLTARPRFVVARRPGRMGL